MFIIGAILRWAVLLGYLICSYLYIRRLAARQDQARDVATPLLILVAGLHALFLVETFAEYGRLTFLTTALRATTLYALVFAVLTLVVETRSGNKAFGAFGVPIAAVLYILSLAERQAHAGVNPLLDSNWFEVHVMSAFVGYGAFGLAFVAGLMYLILAAEIRRRNLGRLFTRLPSLEMLDQLGFRAVAFGFSLFTVALVSGGIWAQQATGRFWSGELKELGSVATWAVFAVYLAARRVGWRGRRSAMISILGFAISLFNYLAAGGTGSGRHTL